MFDRLKKYAAKAATVGAGVVGMAQAAMAQVDITEVQTAITAAEESAHSVAGYVIGVVASLTVVGIVIGLIKKL